eukprot:4592005-Prorocentrum_lima.AAC.1
MRSLHPGGHCYVLDFVSKKFNVVARSSFAAELRNLLDAAQSGIFYSPFMEENLEANLTANQLSERLDNGKL